MLGKSRVVRARVGVWITLLALVLTLFGGPSTASAASGSGSSVVEGRTTLSCPSGSGSYREDHSVRWRLDRSAGTFDLLDDITPSYFDVDWVSADVVAHVMVEGEVLDASRLRVPQAGPAFTSLSGLRFSGAVASGQTELVGLDLEGAFRHPESGTLVEHELACTGPEVTTGTVSGRVELPAGVARDAVTVVAGRLNGYQGVALSTATPAADGTFSLVGVPAGGDLRVWVEDASGLLAPHAWQNAASPFRGTPVAVYAGSTTSGLVLRPVRAAYLGGKIGLAPGESRTAGEVRVLAQDEHSEWDVVETVKVGADLRYRLAVEGGRSYRVEYRSWAAGGTVWAYGGVRTATSAGAATLRLEPGQTRTDIDVIRPLGATVSGRVLLPAKHPTSQATVSLAPWVDGVTSDEGAAESRLKADGTFSFAHVVPGDYVLVATSERSNSVAWLGAEGDPRVIRVGRGRSVTGLTLKVPADWAGLAIRQVKVPKVSGKARVGRTLKASKGTWKPTTAGTKVSVKFQWQTKKRGKAVTIKRATKSKLKLTKALRGKQVRVTVTVTAKGHRSATYATKWSAKVR